MQVNFENVGIFRYNLKSQMNFLVPTVNSYHPQLSFLWSAKNWVLVPAEIKNIKSLEGFKTNIRQWKPSISNCKPYRPRLSRWLCWFVIEIMLVKIPLELHIPSVFKTWK